MRRFILGIIATLAVLALGGLAIATLGFLPTNADSVPPRWSAASPTPPWTPPWSATPRV